MVPFFVCDYFGGKAGTVRLRRATHLLVQRSLKGSLTLIAKITFLSTSFTLIAKMRRQIRAAQPCLLNLQQSCRSRLIRPSSHR